MARLFMKILVFLLIVTSGVNAQNSPLSFGDCVSYALQNSTDIGRAAVDIERKVSSLEQQHAEQLPNLALNANENWSYGSSFNSGNSEWNSATSSSNLNLSLNSSLLLYNGSRLKNQVRQSEINLLASNAEMASEEERITLNILVGYVRVLLSKAKVKSSEVLLASTEQAFQEATIRYDAGALSPSDFLNVKSQLSSDKANLVLNQSELRIYKVALMQYMNMPINNQFSIVDIDLDMISSLAEVPVVDSAFERALTIDPTVRKSLLDLEDADINIKLVKADALPSLALSGSVQTNFTDNTLPNFGQQIYHQVTPVVGLSLSVPIFQRKQIKDGITQATLQKRASEYNLSDVKSTLRKVIEQAYTDLQSAFSTYNSYVEQHSAEEASYKLADEMFSQGLMSSTDYLVSKNSLYTVENQLIQSKYSVILQKEIIDYYLGEDIEL